MSGGSKMTVKFQAKVLRFFCRPENKRYVDLVDDQCFDTPEMKLCYEVVRAYVKEFGAVPDVVSAVEYLVQTPAVQRMKPDVIAEYVGYLERSFEHRSEDTGLVIKSILDYAARKRTTELFKKSMDKIVEGGISEVKNIHGELGKIATLDHTVMELENRKGGFLIKDHTRTIRRIVPGMPCFLKKVNRMTAAHGFKSPELVVLLSAPKGFKTGLALNMAMEYVRNGAKVYYADYENGINSIQDRASQQLMECTREELSEPENVKTLTQIMRRIGKLGGDITVNNYAAHSSSVADVEQHLSELYADTGWRPDLIIWDYPDLIKPIVPQKESRHNISRVYFDIINLNNRIGCFSIGVSQVNRQAVEKDVLTMTDFAEDFAKAMNCHSAWALCRTPAEVEAGLGRIVPVAQREGVRYKSSNVCWVKIEEEKMKITEIGLEEAIAQLGTKGRTVRKPRKDLKDE